MTLGETWDAMADEPLKAVGGVLVIALLIGGVLVASQAAFDGLQSGFTGAPQEDLADRDRPVADGGDSGAGEFVEVQEASYDVTADDAETAASTTATIAQDFSGYVQSRTKRESTRQVTVHMTVRVPVDDFEAFNQEVRDRLDVSTYEVRNYRVSIQRELDEIAVLERSLQDYEDIRERVLAEETTTESLELLATLTEKELWVTEQLRYYQRELSETQQRGDLATVQVTITQDKDVDIVPEDIGDRFREAVKQMLDDTVRIVIDTVTGVLVVFLQVVQAIIYLVVILVPLMLAYRVGRRFYRRYWPESQE